MVLPVCYMLYQARYGGNLYHLVSACTMLVCAFNIIYKMWLGAVYYFIFLVGISMVCVLLLWLTLELIDDFLDSYQVGSC